MKTIIKMLDCLVSSLALCFSVMVADYDRVINSGRVMDAEAMFQAVRNVGVKDGRVSKERTQLTLEVNRKERFLS